MIIEKNFRNRLKTLIGDQEIKALSKECGVTDGAMRSWVREGGSEPKLSNLVKLASYFKVNVGWLAAGEEPKFHNHPAERSTMLNKKIAASIEPGEKRKKEKTFEKQNPPADTQVETETETEQINLKDMVSMTISVLESPTIYRTALASNIRAFYSAVVMEGDVEQLKDQVGRMESKYDENFKELKEMLQEQGKLVDLDKKRESEG